MTPKYSTNIHKMWGTGKLFEGIWEGKSFSFEDKKSRIVEMHGGGKTPRINSPFSLDRFIHSWVQMFWNWKRGFVWIEITIWYKLTLLLHNYQCLSLIGPLNTSVVCTLVLLLIYVNSWRVESETRITRIRNFSWYLQNKCYNKYFLLLSIFYTINNQPIAGSKQITFSN